MSTTPTKYPRRGSLHTWNSPTGTGPHEGHTVAFMSHTTNPEIVLIRCTHDHAEAHTYLDYLTPIPGDPRLMPTPSRLLPIGCRVRATTSRGNIHTGTIAGHLDDPVQYLVAIDRNDKGPDAGTTVAWDEYLVESISSAPRIPAYDYDLTPAHYSFLVGTRVSVRIPITSGSGETHHAGTVVPPKDPRDSPTCCYVLLDKKLSRPNPFGFFHEHIESLVGPDLFDLTPLDHTVITVSLRVPSEEIPEDWFETDDDPSTITVLDFLFEHHDALTITTKGDPR